MFELDAKKGPMAKNIRLVGGTTGVPRLEARFNIDVRQYSEASERLQQVEAI
jgi:hypothetical protein